MRDLLRRLIDKIAFYYPFTFTGSLLVAAAIYVMGKAFAYRNPYGWILSSVLILFLLVFSVIGRLMARRGQKKQVEWDSSSPLYAGRSDHSQRIRIEDLNLFPFFRLHFLLRGRMKVGRNAGIFLWQDASSRGGDTVDLSLHLPFCGTVEGIGSLAIKDLFGFTRSRFGVSMRRDLTVRPALLTETEPPTVQALDGLENKSKQKESDVERYFMRDYMPGDRYRDINWKASSRFSELFTRIAPVTQEKTHVLSVLIRPYRRKGRETASSLAHLNYAKSWCLLFLKSVKSAHPDYQFMVSVGTEKRHLKSAEDIELLAIDLAALHYQAAPPLSHDDPSLTNPGEIFVFTTVYDETLNVYFGARPGTHIFTTAFPDGKGETVDSSLFHSDSTLFSPGPWIVPDFGERRRMAGRSFLGTSVVQNVVVLRLFATEGVGS